MICYDDILMCLHPDPRFGIASKGHKGNRRRSRGPHSSRNGSGVSFLKELYLLGDLQFGDVGLLEGDPEEQILDQLLCINHLSDLALILHHHGRHSTLGR